MNGGRGHKGFRIKSATPFRSNLVPSGLQNILPQTYTNPPGLCAQTLGGDIMLEGAVTTVVNVRKMTTIAVKALKKLILAAVNANT